MLGASWTWLIAAHSSRLGLHHHEAAARGAASSPAVRLATTVRPCTPPHAAPSSPPSDLSREIDATSATGRVK